VKRKMLNRARLEGMTAKNLKSYLIGMTIASVGFILIICGSYVFNKIYNEKIYIQVFLWLFSIFILGGMIHSTIKGYKKLKNTKYAPKNYIIIESYLLRKVAREGADEHGDSYIYKFWCGESYGMIDVFHAGAVGIGGGRIGNAFYIAVRFSPEENRYIGEWCFSKKKYVLDEELKNKLLHISYEEFEEKANSLNIRLKKSD